MPGDPMKGKNSLLTIQDLFVNYRARKVLKGVSLKVGRGEIVALIGANGAGKTTLIKSICGLLAPVSGIIEFEERRISELPPDKITAAGISCVPEGRRLFPLMTVLENLEMGAFIRADSFQIREDVDRVIKLFPILRERKKELAGALSGGMQQMVAIGRGLMARPRLLIIDESSFGLAPLVVKDITRTLMELNREGMTLLLVEQNAKVALEMAHRAYVLETGRVNLEGPGRELLNNEQVIKAYLGVSGPMTLP